MVFWWTHRGFLSLLFFLGPLGLLGAVMTQFLGSDAFERYPWLWGLGLSLGCVANWIGGVRLNRAPMNPFVGKLSDRFTYRARNRFLSLPMEAWSEPMLVLAIVLTVKGLL